MDVAEKGQHHDSSFNDYVWLGIFDERAVLNQIFVSLIDICSEVWDFIIIFLALFTKGHIDALDTEVASHGNSSINVIAKTFEKFCGLGFHNKWLLLVTCVKGEVHEFLRVVIHLLSLGFCSLDEIESYVEYQIWQESEENVLEVIILSGETQIFESLNYKVADSLFIEQLLKIRPLSKNNKRLDHHWNQIGQSI